MKGKKLVELLMNIFPIRTFLISQATNDTKALKHSIMHLLVMIAMLMLGLIVSEIATQIIYVIFNHSDAIMPAKLGEFLAGTLLILVYIGVFVGTFAVGYYYNSYAMKKLGR
ncbi:hypothetical protein [Staphylococcus capitis]|uniref:Uncharacterized protein n=1 Tax=Staphylococcus capitis TaxID=29388 RepID=A0ABX1SRU2_STACP|nr:hypothetical protein [Staphylococcus capitis]NMK54007.1 hypothetical protein [Staphylococcus capitis]NMK69301.1 hypothetical protein [Staphylococcus capitis]